MKLSDSSIDGVCLAAYVYDIGLASMPISVIHESERLTGINLTMYRDYP